MSPGELHPSRVALVLLLALPVFVVNPWAKDLLVGPQDAAVQLLIVCALLAVVLSPGQNQLWIPVSSVSAPLAGLILLAGLSAARSVDPLWSLLEVSHLALLVILFHLLLGQRGARERVIVIFRTMAIAGGVAALYGLLQLAFGLEIVHTEGRFVPFSFFGHRNYAAEYILLVLPPALVLTLLAPSRRALSLWSTVSVLLVLHLATTQTRAALLGLTFGLLGSLAYRRYASKGAGDPSPSRRRWILVGSTLALGYALFFFPQPFKVTRPIATRVLQSEGLATARVQELATRTSPDKALFDPSNLRSRVSVWRAGLRLIRDHPWTGVGLTNFLIVFPPRYQPFDLWWPSGLVAVFLHNELLQVAAELGLPAVILVLWILALLGMILYRSLSASLPGPDGLWIAASLCALIAIGVDSLFSFPWHLPVQRLYAVIHGACLVALAADGRSRGIRIARPSGFVVAGAFLLIVALGPLRLQVAEVYAMSGWNALNRGAYAEAVAAYHSASSWFPPMFPRARLVMEAQDPRPHFEKAVRQFRAALQRDPQDEEALANLGQALQGAGLLDEAWEVFHRLLEKRPGDPAILRRLIDLALARGSPAEAHHHYEALTARTPCDGSLLLRIGMGYHRSGDRETARAIRERAVACDPRLKRLAH